LHQKLFGSLHPLQCWWDGLHAAAPVHTTELDCVTVDNTFISLNLYSLTSGLSTVVTL